MTAGDLRALRLPLLVLCAAVIAAAAAVYYTRTLVTQAELALSRQNNELRSAQARMRQSGDERDTIVKYVDRYRELERLGFAGEEQRINWLDALRTAGSATGLFGIRYQIGVQYPYPYAAELDPGTVLLQESMMELDMNLLHEGDLLRFLDSLHAQRVGIFQVRNCSLSRAEKTEVLRNQAHVTARCNLAWITARPGSASGRGGVK
jgi:hypothetical protein